MILQLFITGSSKAILRATFPGKPFRYFLLLSSRERRKTVQFLLLSGDQSLLSPPPSWLQGSVLECIHLPAFTYCSSSRSFPRSHSRTGSPIDAVTPGQSVSWPTPCAKAASRAPVQPLPTRHFTKTIRHLPWTSKWDPTPSERTNVSTSTRSHNSSPAAWGGLCVVPLLPISKWAVTASSSPLPLLSLSHAQVRQCWAAGRTAAF